MEHTTLFFNAKRFGQCLVALLLFLSFGSFAQTTVTYNMGNTGYFTTQVTGTSGTFQANGNTELGMYSNGGGTKNVVAYRTFKTAGDNTGSTRALQVGDVFSLQVYASAAFGQIGFSLNTANVTTNYGTRNTNSRLYVQEDGTNGSWYVNSSAGNETLDYNVGSTYRNYLFKVYITSETTCDVELIVDGTTTKRLFNRTMNGATGANITGFALYLSDDYNGSGNANVYWKQVTEVRANTLVNMGYYLPTGNFTPGRITNGLEANSTSTTSVNKLNIGGDAGTTIIFNQPNTFSGATIVNPNARGELQHAQALGNSPNVTVSNNGALSLYSPTGIAYNNYWLNLNGNGQNGANGALRNVGGTNSWPGHIVLESSSRINADISGSLSLGGGIDIPSGMALTFGGTQPITVSSFINGPGQVAKDGANTLNLTTFNSFIGGLSISNGTVQAAFGDALGSGIISFPSSASAATIGFTNSTMLTTPLSIASAKATVDIPATKEVDFFNEISGTGRLTKMGAGNLNLWPSPNTLSGGINLGNGLMRIQNSNNLGTGTLRLGYDANDVSQANNVRLETNPGVHFSNPVIVATNDGGASRTVATFTGQTTSINGAITLNGTLSTSGGGLIQFSNAITGSGGLNCSAALNFIGGPCSYLGNTTVNTNAILRLANSNVMPDVSNLVLNGGAFQTDGFNEAMNLLALENNSAIAFTGGGSHVISFANSSEEPWTGTLTITGWTGTAGQSNTTGGRIMVGVNGLSALQLSQIVFQGFSGTPIILPSGELVPPAPMLAITAGSTDHGNSCVGSGATTITYTISNTGGDAADISVISDNAEFVVSNLSSTTIANNATATYDVTFTPSGSGARNAIITIGTTTPNSNAPITSNLTGNGIVPTAYYADADTDAYGDASATATVSCTPVMGAVTNNLDCDDNNDAINPDALEICDGLDNDCDGLTDGLDPSVDNSTGATFYADNDLDGFGAGAPVMACSAPAGHATNNIDCNDNNSAVHPGATEIGYNLIDDDCDGSTDEGFAPKVTIVQGAQCNTTLAAIDTQIVANIVAGAQGYHWRITTMSGPNAGQEQTLNTALRTMKLTQLLNYAYETQYKVEVGVYYAGYPQPFGVSNCLVTTPQGISALTNCNQTLTSMSNAVYANVVPFAGGYRFRISDPINPLSTQVIERSVRDFTMTQITNFLVQYGKTYNVAVSVKNTDGAWMPYSADCQVTTPVFPTTSLQDSQCDGYMVPTNATQLYALSYPGAIAYVFQLSGGGLPSPVEVTKGTRTFTINDFAGQVTPGATYNVKVRLIFNMSDPAGPYGKTCSITTPGLARTIDIKNTFDAVAHPNPFADSFNIDIRTMTTDGVTIKVYDMMGRLLENVKVKAGSTIQPIGNHFPAGVYNVIVAQGNETKILRIIKR